MMAGEKLFSIAVRIGKGLLLAGEIQVVMQLLALAILPVPHLHCRGQTLVWSGEACAFHNIANDLELQGVSQVSSFVDQSAASILVTGDGRKVPVRIGK